MVLGYLWDMYRPSTFGFGSFEALSSSNRFAAEGGVMMSVVSFCCSDYLFSHYWIMQLRSGVCGRGSEERSGSLRSPYSNLGNERSIFFKLQPFNLQPEDAGSWLCLQRVSSLIASLRMHMWALSSE